MKILIVDFDIIGKTGGGQTAYAKLIGKMQQHQFFYFTRSCEPASAGPANAHAIPFRERYIARSGGLGDELGPLYFRYVECCQFAASVKAHLGACEFDVIDVPDYTTHGLFIRQALEHHGVHVARVALALHGTITHALQGDWSPTPALTNLSRQLSYLEKIQFEIADLRYAISESYKEYWEMGSKYPVTLISPLHIVGDMPQAPISEIPDLGQSALKPTLLFIGRKEKRKGPDLFLDLAWAAGPQHFSAIKLIGEESHGLSGTSSQHALQTISANRNLTVEHMPAVAFSELERVFHERTIVVLPSRLDSFNLVALEALRTSCPVFVSKQAGVSRWIIDNYPELSELVIDLSCSRLSAVSIRNAAVDYTAFRTKIGRALSARPTSAPIEQLSSLYRSRADFDAHRRDEFQGLAEHFRAHYPPVAQPVAFERQLATGAGQSGALWIEQATPIASRAHAIVSAAGSFRSFFTETIDALPRDDSASRHWITRYSDAVVSHRHSRIQIFEKLGQLEDTRSRDLTSALYHLRSLRWLGYDRDNKLEFIGKTFKSHHFQQEASVVEAMYRDPAKSYRRCLEYISQQDRDLKSVNFSEFEFVDDRRRNPSYKVAVVCSLYNAADKLPTLVQNIAGQTLVESGDVEVVLVDSGSPGGDYAVFRQLAEQYTLPFVYARSVERETIQAAWNRGISLSRAPYLCFYGADEGMHPDCLGILSAILDTRRDIDWVMADSVVTDVEANGIFAKDVMKYDRSGFDKDMVYLDTCYLSWVGGLYRRSIHDKFGYYDSSFRAAGDTEFKSRILNKINVLHVPQPLGVFNNYPEERTTAHPRAEIEDQRAWYLHRTAAGMANLFNSRGSGEAIDLLRKCFSYRKSYCGHISTDFDLAKALVDYLTIRAGHQDGLRESRRLVDRALALLREVEMMSLVAPPAAADHTLSSIFREFQALELEAVKIFDLDQRPDFSIFNDNRFEQHWWSWSVA